MKPRIYLSYVSALLFVFTLMFNINVASSQTTDTVKSKNLKQVEVVGKTTPTGKTVISAEATASPASVTLAGRDYISKQAVLSYGDLLRPMAGVNVTNYQLGGVGYGIEMRGYTTTEHARDIFFTIDGVPQNQGSSIQTNGYVDLNMLMPENIRRIEVTRGPFSPLYGDHALGGAISFETENNVANSVVLSGGTYGFLRGLATVGFGRNGNTGYVSVEGGRSDGYRQNGGEKHLNGFAKYTFHLLNGTASVRAQAYGSDFNTAGFISQAGIDSGTVSKKQAINPTDGGSTRQQNFVFNYRDKDTTSFSSVTLYVQHHDFDRIRTNLIGGPQRDERDNRVWFGGDVHHTISTTLAGMPVMYIGGLSFRGDAISDTRFTALNRQDVQQVQDRQINTYTPSVYAEAQFKPAEKLKVTLGARYDYLMNTINTGAAETSLPQLHINPKTDVFSPKAGLSYQLTHVVNVFASVSQGFRAPSAYDEYPFNQTLAVSKVTSYEIGIGGDHPNGRLHGLISGYISRQSNEIGVDPLGNLTNFGKTRRNGIEAEGRAVLTSSGSIAVFGNYSAVLAKVIDGGNDNIYVTNTPKYTGLAGIDYDFAAGKIMNNRFILSVYDQLVGGKYLNTSGSVQSPSFQRLAGKLSYSRHSWNRFSVFIEGSYYPGNGALDEVKFLLGNNVVTAPQAPFTVDAGIKLPF